MSPRNSSTSHYSRYIGRVGALATALGIGVLVVTSPGVALADDTGTSSESSTNSTDATDSTPSTGTESGPSTPTKTPEITEPTTGGTSESTGASTPTVKTATPSSTSGATAATTEVAPGVTVSSSGGAHTSGTEDAMAPEPAPSKSTEPEPAHNDSPAPVAKASATPSAPTVTADNVMKATSATGTATTQPAAQPAAVVAVKTAPSRRAFAVASTPTALAAPSAAAVAPAAPISPVAPAIAVVSFLNQVVTNLLTPFLAPAPHTPDPLTPVVWAVLAYVRRNLFNEAPTVAYDPTHTSQTGQTVTGDIGASDAEGDALTYTVTQGPEHGTLTIDQATGKFTYTPDDIDYTAVQSDSFTVSVTDGRTNLLSLFGAPRSVTTDIDLAVLSPEAERIIVNLPAGFTNAQIPRFAADGQSLLFSATPPGAATGARMEVYHVNVDGTGLSCITCNLADPTPLRAGTTAPRSLFKPVPFEDGSGRILMQSVDPGNGAYTHVVYEPDTNRLVRILTPAGKPGVVITDPQREMRISPDGTHVLFSQIQLVPNGLDAPGFITAVPIVGTLTPSVDAGGNTVYTITDARVVYPVGEGKQFTHDGKGVIILGGLYDAGNVDDIVVDLATGNVTRVTGNLDYDEDADMSPNNQWITIDSARAQDALTPVSRIVRPAFLPLLVQGSVYTAYAGTSNAQNISNQPWLIRIEDDLDRENGIPLFDFGDGWVARSMPSWNADGTEVAFWEAKASDPTGATSRLVVSKLKYTTSVGTAGDQTTPMLADATVFPTLATNTPKQVALPEAGTVVAPKIYAGAGGGTAAVSETTNATTGHVVRTVTYTDYVNDEGMVLNGTESTDQSAAQNTIHYIVNVVVTGTHTGSLTGDATVNKLTRVITPTTPTSQIQSTLDGDTLVLLDPARIADSRAGV